MSFLDKFLGVDKPHEGKAPPAYLEALQRRDYVSALPLLNDALLRDDPVAMGFMAALTALGRGVEKDPVDACKWFRQAAVRGHAPSQAALGMCLARGLGVAVNRKEAAYWLYKAAVAGNLKATEDLAELAFVDNSVVGESFSEDDLCDLVRNMRKRSRVASNTGTDGLLH